VGGKKQQERERREKGVRNYGHTKEIQEGAFRESEFGQFRKPFKFLGDKKLNKRRPPRGKNSQNETGTLVGRKFESGTPNGKGVNFKENLKGNHREGKFRGRKRFPTI